MFIVWIPADPVQEGKSIPHGNTNHGAKLHSSSCLATNNRTNLSLNQVDDTVGEAARRSVQQDTLLAVHLADHDKFVPPMRLQARKACPRGDEGIDGIKIPLQIVELVVYCGVYLAATWLLLLGNTEETGRCLLRSQRFSQRASMIPSVDPLFSFRNFRSVG